MDDSTKAFVLKVAGGAIAIAIGVAGLTMPPVLAIPPVMAGGFIVGGLLAFGVNIGATVAAGREAALLRAARKTYPPKTIHN